MQKVHKAVIPAAGYGTRLLPATKVIPKEMLPIIDTPIIEFAIREAVNSGIDDILIITSRGKESIENHLDAALELENHLTSRGQMQLLSRIALTTSISIHFIRQSRMLGLGHAVLLAKQHIGCEPFALLLPDEIHESSTPCTAQLIDHYSKDGHSVVALRKIPTNEVERYGIAEGVVDDRRVRIERLIEKPKPSETDSRLAVCGRYILNSSLFRILERTAPGKNSEIQLTDALQTLLESSPLRGLLVDSHVYDVGSSLGYAQASISHALRRPDIRADLWPFLESLLRREQSLPLVATSKDSPSDSRK